MNFDNLLENRNILIAVTGSIAIYKSLELIRLFIKAGANVRVIMSEDAKKFITPLTFEAISQNTVLHTETESWADDNNHIKITEWAESFVIAPATANTINKLANGVSDNLITQSALAYDRETVIAPSMNTKMLNATVTERNMKLLSLSGYKILSTENKLLACNTKGDGAMCEPIEIFYQVAKNLLEDEYWKYRRVIVTGGGTIERVDDVRFLSNFSSGKMAYSLALALYLKGADVCFITTKDFEMPKEIYKIGVESSSEMFEYLEDSIRVAKKGKVIKPKLSDDFDSPKLIQKEPFVFMVSAVSDYRVKFKQDGKLKKEMLGESWNLELTKNIDILNSINRDGVKTIGFKAEMDSEKAIENAKNMLINKNLSGVCLNILNENNSFGSDENKIEFISKSKIIDIPKMDKLSLSFKILKNCKNIV